MGTDQFRAELTSGEIVILEKDCGCVTHQGPHWIHSDDTYRSMNRDILERACGNADDIMARFDAGETITWSEGVGAELAFHGFAQEEVARLQSKEREMKNRGIVRIIRPGEDCKTEKETPD